MESIKLLAPAKVNLVLQVLWKRSDQYHEIQSLMQRVSWGDELLLRKRKRGVVLKARSVGLPSEPENLAYRAAEYFFESSGIDGGVEIVLWKRIPIGAGLGGGSSDAAAVLRGLSCLWGEEPRFSSKEIARRLGADVPFFLKGSPAIARGIGEELEPIDKFPNLWYLLLFAPVFVPTRQAYEALRLTNEKSEITIPKKIKDIEDLKPLVANAFEPWVLERWPELQNLKKELVDAGAKIAGMSGSGATFFGVFPLKREAREAQKRLLQRGFQSSVVAQGIRESETLYVENEAKEF